MNLKVFFLSLYIMVSIFTKVTGEKLSTINIFYLDKFSQTLSILSNPVFKTEFHKEYNELISRRHLSFNLQPKTTKCSFFHIPAPITNWLRSTVSTISTVPSSKVTLILGLLYSYQISFRNVDKVFGVWIFLNFLNSVDICSMWCNQIPFVALVIIRRKKVTDRVAEISQNANGQNCPKCIMM
jgi:hypothetical protein